MKKILAALSISLAFAAPLVSADDVVVRAPPAAAVPAADPAALAAAHELFESMNYRATLQGMFAQMRQAMPGIMRQSAMAAINANPKLTAAQKQAAQAKVEQTLPKAVASMDGVFGDPAFLDDMLRDTAQIYANHFTVDELHQIAAFYKTPVGVKMLASMPQVMSEAMQMSQRIVMPRITAMAQKMAEEK